MGKLALESQEWGLNLIRNKLWLRLKASEHVNAMIKFTLKEFKYRASLVAQWLRICLPMQETRVRALVWEDPTCRGATKPVSHNY